ncbi:hypothetical protein SAMN05216243_1463 [Sediminibacillus albus]|uniref:Uncharacterized protein n=1 Tax=Sediminibacillus albus TaxID=407036 RepID=A0A1G8Y861_9BACI|nr:hypothetical protein SAMN05216243_1463 [Sediminibacillus albus]
MNRYGRHVADFPLKKLRDYRPTLGKGHKTLSENSLTKKMKMRFQR